MDAAFCKGTKLGVLYGLSQLILQFTFGILFYFGVLINFLWAVVPGYMFIRVVLSEIAEKSGAESKSAKNGKSKGGKRD